MQEVSGSIPLGSTSLLLDLVKQTLRDFGAAASLFPPGQHGRQHMPIVGWVQQFRSLAGQEHGHSIADITIT